MESIKKWETVFGQGEYSFYFAPGRVNLIGEHIDYLGGHVLPCAISLGTYMAIKANDTNSFRFFSESFDNLGVIEFPINASYDTIPKEWVRYPYAVLDLMRKTYDLAYQGYDFYFASNLPKGAGLSSSASIEMIMAVMVKEEHKLAISMKDLSLLSQKAENEYLGVNSGIMDQYSIGLGKKNHGLLLDCGQVKHKLVPIDLGEYRIVMTNSNKERALADSKYNQRRQECDQAADKICPLYEAEELCHLGLDAVEKAKDLLNDVPFRRLRHAVTENLRTIKAFDALSVGNLESFGQLMKLSHQSLRDDYEVTGDHLDKLYELQEQVEGCIGTRMTGAGFGGCTVSIVKEDKIPDFVNQVKRAYQCQMGISPDFYIAEVSDGARVIREEEMLS